MSDVNDLLALTFGNCVLGLKAESCGLLNIGLCTLFTFLRYFRIQKT